MNRHLASAANELEADMIIARLAEAGIRAWPSDAGAFGRGGGAGPRDVYVEDADLTRARQTLEEAESISEADLIALSEESPPPPE